MKNTYFTGLNTSHLPIIFSHRLWIHNAQLYATEPPSPLDYRRSNLQNWRVERQDVAESKVRPGMAYLCGRQFRKLRRSLSVIVG